MNIQYSYLGKVNYEHALEVMHEHIPKALLELKGFWWGLEHDRVYTKGITFSGDHVIDKNIKPIPARRGGSITLHNPGQLVFYSVFPLSLIKGGLQVYIRYLEAAIIQTLWSYDILAFQLWPYSGVWTAQGKIGFVGLGVKNGVVYHGVAVNLTNDLNDYNAIISCGIPLPVTRLEDHATIYGEDLKVDPESILREFSERLQDHLKSRFMKTDGSKFRAYVENILNDFYEKSLSFRLGQLFFNERRFWEAHEAWEIFWHRTKEGEFKKFLHGLIQFASALYKITTKINLSGAYSLFRKALEKLKDNSYTGKYIETLGDQMPLKEYIRQNLKNIDTLIRSKGKVDISEIKKKIYLPYILAGKHDQNIFNG